MKTRIPLLFSFLLSSTTAPIATALARPALTPQQIESDWLRQDELRVQPSTGHAVTPEEDALGGCDGVKNGQWGFHTAHEEKPWWQIDLGKIAALGQVHLYNRCDLAERNGRIMVLLSQDGETFTTAYQHDGTVFYGHSDGKPLSVSLGGAQARYIRLQLPITTYFHLDEVEIYGPDSQENIALRGEATQSSTSQWSVWHSRNPEQRASYPMETVLKRGLLLSQHLGRLGVDVTRDAASLEGLAEQWRELPRREASEGRKDLYLQARWTVRDMMFKNPLLDFDSILFAKRRPPAFPHMSDQYYGWWSRGGGGIYVLKGFSSGKPRLRCLTKDMAEGSFMRPDVSFDGRRVLFAYCRTYPGTHAVKDKVRRETLPEDVFYSLYEMKIDGSDRRQLTRGRYDDFDGRYLPNGEVIFLSTRKGQALQCSQKSASATRERDLPLSYVRCGGDNWRPVPVFTLHTMDGEGGDLQPASAFETFEWTPAVGSDGQVLYARWDYIDRFNGPFMSLWSTHPDGTNPQLVYGNFTKIPQCVFEGRPVPNSQKIVFTAAAHHSNMGGSLALLDRTLGTEGLAPITRLTPEVCFPETEGWPDHYYANPYPLSEHLFLVAWSDRKLPSHTFVAHEHGNPSGSMGLYLYDAFGNQELLYRDPEISSMYPLPVKPRPKPTTLPDQIDWQDPPWGRFVVQDVYEGLKGIQRGTVRRLRVVGVVPKVQPHMNRPVLGVSAEDPGKFVLGTVPVEEDGSAHFYAPSGVPVFFQVLDDRGMALQTMRTLTYTQPNQTLSCIGCHEHRDKAPHMVRRVQAAQREPSRLTPGPQGTWPLRFDELVQPVLDKQCIRCHRPDGEEKQASAFDLTSAHAYNSLIAFSKDDLKHLAFEKDRSTVGDMPARKSRILAQLTGENGHHEVKLTDEDFRRLVVWMDTYAHRLGSFSDDQEQDLRTLRGDLAMILQE